MQETGVENTNSDTKGLPTRNTNSDTSQGTSHEEECVCVGGGERGKEQRTRHPPAETWTDKSSLGVAGAMKKRWSARNRVTAQGLGWYIY